MAKPRQPCGLAGFGSSCLRSFPPPHGLVVGAGGGAPVVDDRLLACLALGAQLASGGLDLFAPDCLLVDPHRLFLS